MKAQMKFQKILTLVTLLVGALCFVFALCFFSGNLSDLMFYKSDNHPQRFYDYAEFSDYFIQDGQTFVSILVVLSIVFICAAAFLYITSTNTRRNYYVTNYVAIGIVIAIAAVTAVITLAYMFILIADFQAIEIDLADTSYGIGYMYNALKDQGAPEVSTSPLMFILGIVVAIVALATAVVWALNLVWKLKLMKGEKALLAGEAVKEVA